MSYLLKELEAGKNQDGLQKVLDSAQELGRGERRARNSSEQQRLDTPSTAATPDRRNREAIQPATPKGKRPLRTPPTPKGKTPLPSTPTREEQRRRQSGRPTALKGKTLLPLSEPGAPEQDSGEQRKSSGLRIKLKLSSNSRQKPPETLRFPNSSSLDTGPIMTSQRNRPARGGPRGGTNDLTEEKDLWDQIRPLLASINKAEARAAEVNKEIFEDEVQKKEKLNAGTKPPIEGVDHLSTLYRDQVRNAEHQKARAQDEDLHQKLSVLMGMVKHNEETMDAQPPARVSSSRTSAMEFDGPSDSPIPSPAENKQVRKIGPSRTSSQPPRSATDVKPDTGPAESSERGSKPKIVYAQGEEVAFKRKIPGKTDEQDWILGKVVRVIGEGKSRRYEVQDPFPDEGSTNTLYKSSASQMVPIPAEGTPLDDYELGKRVLALYPDTTTFYRAEVKAMLEDGARVQLLFEDEAAGALKIVERRLVLDHKG